MKYKMKISCFTMLLIVFGCIMIAPVLGAKVEEKPNEPCPFEGIVKQIANPIAIHDKSFYSSSMMLPLHDFYLYYSNGDPLNSRTINHWGQTSTSPTTVCPYMSVASSLQRYNGVSWDLVGSTAIASDTDVSSEKCTGTTQLAQGGTYRIVSCHQTTNPPGHTPENVHYDLYGQSFVVT